MGFDFFNNTLKYIGLNYRHYSQILTKEMQSLNIGSGQYVYLFLLYEKDGVSQQELSNRLLVDKSATKRALEKLEINGYIYRQNSSSDKRVTEVFLTQKGKEIKPKLDSILEKTENKLLKNLNKEERETFLKLLNRAFDGISN